MTIAAIVVALAAASCYAVAATLQHQAAHQEPVSQMLDPRLLIRLLHRPVWLAGGAADVAGAGLHGFALVLGPLALVQPLLVCGVIMAVPLEASLDRRRPNRRDLVAVLVSGAGLATFLAVAQPTPGPHRPDQAPLLGVVIGVGLVVAALLVLSTRVPTGFRATLLGVAAGAGYALSATLAKACLDRIAEDGWGVLSDWRLYAMGAVALVSVELNQNAFQAGTLAGPLTGIVLTDPMVSLVIAVTAYEEQLSTGGLRWVVELLALGVMAWGIWLVSTVTSASRTARERPAPDAGPGAG